MDKLYDNLDNYEDHNIIEQLKSENTELKNKLEEYTTAMDKLQKDFDRVSNDFKKIEMNYSSLLKTAKVEIERKTKIIKDLNAEKDMIVLKALQNKDKLNMRSLRGITKPFQKGPANEFGVKSITPSVDNLKEKCDTGISGRKDETRFSSVETVTSSNTDITGRLLKLACSNTESDRTSDTKENMVKKDMEDKNSSNIKALSIRNRRKSMPATKSQAKFSSDEECDDSYCRNEPYKKCFPSREESRQNFDKAFNDRYRHRGLEERNKVSETSSADDRYPGYETNRDTYHRSRNDKYSIDKHKARDRYDNTQRYRRYLSPERSRRAPRKEDYYQRERERQEYGRRRLLESPPADKFSHYQQRNRESLSKHEREDFEKRNRQHERYPSKHKMIDENYEEPSGKRQKISPFDQYPEEEKRWVRDKGVPLERSVSDLLEEMPQYTSCQSPDDYLMSDESSPLPVKEIMNTATTPLEDPRTQSSKYLLKASDNNAELCTITGRNVDLQIVDLSKWGMNQVEKPLALTRRPSQCGDEIVKEIYMDIENPVSNMSVESGEILTCNEEDPNDGKNQGKNVTVTPDLKSLKTDVNKSEDKTKDSTVKSTYRIPKIKKNDLNKPTQNIIPSKLEGKDPLNTTPISTDDKYKNLQVIRSTPNNDKSVIDVKSKRIKPVQLQDNKVKSCTSSLKLEQKCKESTTVKEIMEGDLELSDDTCDNPVDIKDRASMEPKANQNDKNENKAKSTVSNKVESKVSNKELTDTFKEDNKKQRSKKKVSKPKETDIINEMEQGLEKKDKVKKDKKTKFNELFGGDSNSIIIPEDLGNNSLITPDDLGIAPSLVPQESSVKYSTICEDAQDAVDVNVSDMMKVQTLHLSKPLIEINEPLTSEKQSKSKLKSSNENKKKKSRKTTSDCIVSVEVTPLPNTESCQIVTTKITAKEQPVIISPIEPEPQSISKETEVQKPMQETVEKISIAKTILLKPDGLMKALATSTPQKVLQEGNPEVGTLPTLLESNNSVNENVASVDSGAADASSTHDTLDSQKDTDVPDVRIFVKRRRRVLKKTS